MLEEGRDEQLVATCREGERAGASTPVPEALHPALREPLDDRADRVGDLARGQRDRHRAALALEEQLDREVGVVVGADEGAAHYGKRITPWRSIRHARLPKSCLESLRTSRTLAPPGRGRPARVTRTAASRPPSSRPPGASFRRSTPLRSRTPAVESVWKAAKLPSEYAIGRRR